MLGRGHIVNTAEFEPDYEAIRAAPTRVVVAYGVESDGLSPNAPRRLSPLPSGSSRPRSRAATAAFLAGSTARPAT